MPNVEQKLPYGSKVAIREQIKELYVKGEWNEDTNKLEFLSIDRIMDKYKFDISKQYIQQTCKKEKWTTLRGLIRTKLKEQTTFNDLREIINTSSDYEKRQLRIVEKIHILIDAYLDRYLHLFDEYAPIPEQPEEISIRDIKDITVSLKNLGDVTNSILGQDNRLLNLSKEITEIETNAKKSVKSDNTLSQLEHEALQLLNQIKGME